MVVKHFLLAILIGSRCAVTPKSCDTDPVVWTIAAAGALNYVAPATINRDNTD